ncbi:SIMPL domain-containing protein [Mycobacterium sp.]|uniref:SIMPL domain-containing protein n=1 Tax=Mycobacterium sp. TaxID=1785 RepID=UPI00127C72DB|nr:SIMPL domain-containing protein [Mycobacterium sp.]KAA8970441.1 MAG: DUF541 domain-containing protein [Mycobacterium sp.]
MLRLLVASALAVAALAACDSHPGPAAGTRQVTVTGAGAVEGVPDTLTADVAIEFTAPDVAAAIDRTGQRQQAVITALTGAGVDSKDISTIDVTVQPRYDGGGTVIGYRAADSIRVRVRKTDAASQLLDLIVSTGGDATRIDSVSYSIDDDSELVKNARARAFQDAKDRAGQYAALAGLHLGKLISISEAPPGSTPPRAPMAADVPLPPGRQTVNFSVTAVWELR